MENERKNNPPGAEKGIEEFSKVYRAVSDNAQVGIYIAQNGKYRFINPYIVQHTGYSSEELIGTDVFFLVHPDDREMVRKEATRMLRGDLTVPYEHRIITKNGEVAWVAETIAFIEFEGKRAAIGTTMNITNRKMMEKQLREARDMLIQSEKLAAIGKLSAGVAHEILNPINIMSMRLQMIEMKENLSDAVRETFAVCHAQIGRVVRIAKDLSQFSRISAECNPKEENLEEVIEQVLSLMAPRLKMERVKIERRYGSEIPPVCLDRSRMEQVFFNIIHNAVDAMKDTSDKKLTIEIAPVRCNGGRESARIVFADSGPGIDECNLSRIFDPFFTTKEPGKGTGLGLSVCYRIVQDHGGSIRAENNDSSGASFIIELPIAESAKSQGKLPF